MTDTPFFWTPEDLVAATGGRWLRPPPPGWRARGPCYHAPLFEPGDLLITRGRDGQTGMQPGHADGLLRRAAGVLCAAPEAAPPGPWPVFLVPETYDALLDMGRYARGVFRGRVYGVTGSAGKTTICYLLAFALGRLGSVAATTENTNLPPGVARSLAAMPPDTDHAVVELAIGRIAVSTRIARPHVAIFCNVAPAHLEYHGTLEEIARRKARIFEGLEPGGTAILNRDMLHLDIALAAARRHAGRVVTYGETADADVRLLALRPDGEVRAEVHGETVTYRLGSPGRHMALNSLAVIAAVEAAGGDWRGAVLPALAEVRPAPGRGVRHDLLLNGRALHLIDDSYNANPASMRAGLELLRDSTPGPGGGRIAVLGDMLELGPDSDRHHRDLVHAVADAGVTVVHTVGPRMAALWDALPPHCRGIKAGGPEEMIDALAGQVRSGDVMLVKGSHGSGIHRVVSHLLSVARPPPASPSLPAETAP